MSCSEFVEYKVQSSSEPHAFTYRRVLEWIGGKWQLFYRGEQDAAEVAGMLPLSFLGKGETWAFDDGPILPTRPSDSYLSFSYACINKNHTGAFAVCTYYTLTQLWIWTVDGWCLQAEKRSW
jgi:hypothetical protein